MARTPAQATPDQIAAVTVIRYNLLRTSKLPSPKARVISGQNVLFIIENSWNTARLMMRQVEKTATASDPTTRPKTSIGVCKLRAVDRGMAIKARPTVNNLFT